MNNPTLRKHKFFAGSMYKRNKLSGLVNYILSVLDILLTGQRALAQPQEIQIEITNRCNLSCRHCFRNKNAEIKDISIDNLKKIMGSFKSAFTAWLVGNGEPLMHPKIDDIIDYFNSINAQIIIVTNLNTNSHSTIEALVKKGVRHLHISIDAVDANLYSSIRAGGDIKLVMENIKKINKLKDEYKSSFPEMMINFVALKDNIKELSAIADFAIENKFQKVCVIKMREAGVNSGYFKEQLIEGTPLEKEAGRIIKNTADKLEKKGIIFIVDETIKYSDSKFLAQKNCMVPWKRFQVTLAGDVAPGCCAKFPFFGNIFINDAKQIWNSQKYRLLRAAAKRTQSADCTKCLEAFNEKAL